MHHRKTIPCIYSHNPHRKEVFCADLKGKVVFVTSWFATCPPCLAEMPILSELYSKYKDKEFLLLSFSTDDVGRVNKFLKDHPIAYDIFPGSDAMIRHSMQTSYGFPTNIIVGKSGRIVEFKVGTATDVNGLEKAKNDFMAIIDRELANK